MTSLFEKADIVRTRATFVVFDSKMPQSHDKSQNDLAELTEYYCTYLPDKTAYIFLYCKRDHFSK